MVSIFASREFGFIYCIIGTLAQCAHTYYLIDSVSSLNGIGKTFQAWALSIFISSSLLFFTAIAEDKDEYGDYKTHSDKRIHLAVNLFMWIEIIINLYYYAAHLLLTNGYFVSENAQWFNFIFAIIISCMIPITIKLYAGIIQAKEWLEALKEQNPNESKINEYIKKSDIDEIKNEIREESQNIFEQGTKKFIENFESKVNEITKSNSLGLNKKINDSKINDSKINNSKIDDSKIDETPNNFQFNDI